MSENNKAQNKIYKQWEKKVNPSGNENPGKEITPACAKVSAGTNSYNSARHSWPNMTRQTRAARQQSITHGPISLWHTKREARCEWIMVKGGGGVCRGGREWGPHCSLSRWATRQRNGRCVKRYLSVKVFHQATRMYLWVSAFLSRVPLPLPVYLSVLVLNFN